MPFKSKKQMRYLYAYKPDVAEEFAEHTEKEAYKRLPEYAKDKNHLKEYSKKYRRSKDAQ